ncbi:hypothetical protein KW785_01980 [Candidatus Parcubacteria bacterium]|nr:hypothetical protein [Candidatus Parcubacteria bacterium]
MSFKELLKREIYVVAHGQSAKFRLVKYIVLITLAVALYQWRGGRFVGKVFLVLIIFSLFAHFLFRSKTKGWTRSWWLYKKPLDLP